MHLHVAQVSSGTQSTILSLKLAIIQTAHGACFVVWECCELIAEFGGLLSIEIGKLKYFTLAENLTLVATAVDHPCQPEEGLREEQQGHQQQVVYPVDQVYQPECRWRCQLMMSTTTALWMAATECKCSMMQVTFSSFRKNAFCTATAPSLKTIPCWQAGSYK